VNEYLKDWAKILRNCFRKNLPPSSAELNNLTVLTLDKTTEQIENIFVNKYFL